MTTHVLDVSREGVISSLRSQFTRSTTFLSETLQNARRANARAVWVEWIDHSNTIIIRDDGSGIQDFDALFTHGKSGWDAQVKAEENPFGAGFMAAVLASEHIRIRSLDQEVEFDTRALLNFEPVERHLARDGMNEGTALHLTLKRDVFPVRQRDSTKRTCPTEEYWHHLLSKIVLGFPIPVYFNGAALARPHALNGAMRFLDSEIGSIHLAGWETCEPHEQRWLPRLYFQGLPIEGRTHRGYNGSDILHLDPHSFRARMPDRDVLIDSEQQTARILAGTRTLWRRRILERFSEVDRRTFVERHWRLTVDLGLPELLRDGPLAPSMLQYYVRPVELTETHDRPLKDWGRQVLPGREAIFVDDLDSDYDGTCGSPPAPLACVYAVKHRLPMLAYHVPSCHWACQRRVDLLDPELGLYYAVNGATRTAHYAGEYIDCDVLVCDSYTIEFRPTISCDVPGKLRSHLVPTTVHDVAFYDPHKSCIVVPAQAWAGDAVAQVSSFLGEAEQFCSTEYERDQYGLATLAAGLRSESPQSYLEAMLRNLRPDPDLIGTESYQVRYDTADRRFVVTRN